MFEMDGRLVKCRVSFGLEGRVDRIGRKASRPIWRENEKWGGGGEALGVKKRARGMNEGKRTRAKQETQRRKPKPNPPKMTFVQSHFRGTVYGKGNMAKAVR